jgi:DNA repair exonuclease SbcCD ATPase subunit
MTKVYNRLAQNVSRRQGKMFRKLVAENFMSWERLEFDFKQGIMLVEGWNHDDGSSNGSGKSSIFNALCIALYDKLPKDVNIDEVIREGEKSCTITLFTNDNFQIVRKRGPNERYIVSPTGEVMKGKDAKETQKKIQAMMGMSYETFCQAIYFAQNYPNKFIRATEEEKAKIFSEIQDLTWCDKSAKKAHELYKEYKTEQEKLETKIDSQSSQIRFYQQNLISFERLNDTFEKEKSNEIASLQKECEQLEERLSVALIQHKDLQSVEDIPPLEAKIEAHQEALNGVEAQLSAYEQKRNDYFAALKRQKCPTCGQNVGDDHLLPPEPENPIQVKSERDALKAEMVAYTALLRDAQRQQLQKQQISSTISSLNESLKTYPVRIDTIKQKINPYTEQLATLRVQIKDSETVLSGQKAQLKAFVEKGIGFQALKEGFKEVKSYVFQSLLSELNNRSNKFLQELFEEPVSVSFSNYSEEGEISKIATKVTMNGVERSVGLLSDGQFQRVQLAVDFALSEIVSERSGHPLNLRILDECFKDLDEVNMARAIQLLEKLKGSTIIIEHNSMIKSIVHSTFKVERRDGISYQV